MCGVIRAMDGPQTSPTQADFVDVYQREFAVIAVLAGTTCADVARGEDIAQEAFCRASDRWATSSPPGRFDVSAPLAAAKDLRSRDDEPPSSHPRRKRDRSVIGGSRVPARSTDLGIATDTTTTLCDEVGVGSREIDADGAG